MKLFIAILLGIFLGGIISKFLFVGSWLNLIPWGLGGLAVGLYGKSMKESLINGAVYGFTLSFVFMIVGYNGMRSIFLVLPFFALLGLFGAFCGAFLGILGLHLKKPFGK